MHYKVSITLVIWTLPDDFFIACEASLTYHIYTLLHVRLLSPTIYIHYILQLYGDYVHKGHCNINQICNTASQLQRI